jgi:hypothetical protein
MNVNQMLMGRKQRAATRLAADVFATIRPVTYEIDH